MKETSSSVYQFLARELSAKGKFRVRDSGVECSQGVVFHAVDSMGRLTILVPLSSSEVGFVDWNSKALSLEFKSLEFHNELRPFLILQCTDDKLDSQFALLSDEVLEAIELEPAQALKATLSTLDRWRRLFESDRPGILGPAQLAGLLAELSVLERLVSAHGPKALATWQGPNGNRHDFVLSECSIEVKATTNHNNMVVTIHGSKQLLAAENAALYVHAFQMEPSPEGISVPEKIVDLLAMGVGRLDLLAKLNGAKYSESHSKIYDAVRFSPLMDRTYRVDSRFPRITAETVCPPDVLEKLTDVTYAVDLGQLESSPLDVAQLQFQSVGGS
ncbi:PD-(D/E)XK motif protein [Paenarthrobacter nicotinovorans]|uniref:PD-(D/E)XK motif protein n=1 Tax=Paenarthrobacter nicotinovorans TaxID=29320 RepID=UPI000479FEF7|nr:PD-(D/E)XK motif protein [Paenarthrobacter nicotinovorans]